MISNFFQENLLKTSALKHSREPCVVRPYVLSMQTFVEKRSIDTKILASNPKRAQRARKIPLL